MTLKDESAGNPKQFLWEFGDGTTSTEMNRAHHHITPGTFSVEITVWNPDGGVSAEYQDFITVLSSMPPRDAEKGTV